MRCWSGHSLKMKGCCKRSERPSSALARAPDRVRRDRLWRSCSLTPIPIRHADLVEKCPGRPGYSMAARPVVGGTRATYQIRMPNLNGPAQIQPTNLVLGHHEARVHSVGYCLRVARANRGPT